MIEIIATGLLAVFTIYYVYFIVRIRNGLLSLEPVSLKSLQPTVTVIIAARNEDKSILRCLHSLVNQTYPSNKYEIIIVDDGSTDNTSSIVQAFSAQHTNVHLLSLPAGTERIISRKPFAIAQGIDRGAGEIILTTDADCIVPPRWIEIMVNHFEDNVVFVAGPVAEQTTQYFISKIEQLEFLGLISAAAGLIGSRRPIICNGANLAYRKNAFISAGGFGDTVNSNDDELLMNRMVQRKIGKIVFASESDAVVITQSSNTVLSFLRQRIRWANKRGHYEDKSILITLVTLYLFFLILALEALLIPIESMFLMPVIFAFIAKTFVDYLALRSSSRIFKQRIPFFYFLIAELLHVPYIVIAAAIGQINSIKWKGRIIQR